mmetsp:Transcript_20272/g.28497  ORF Transcript_20272/g.28497 Transcript_20272/m.28497 type:complete len:212 (+) Transcript_20272:65-700(+)|eukprot:CAMPEP_0175095700 /NCGR_PEP_ID=MMETSP0086_2-20121207/4311_1 /TAXON_ID=136419 /ORGANISM="Unknown Unknown, Strain D1" /LENGTH=211 /DNA_ID=CAMNT_0016368997 /DNA_START=65 /DNA_END=700 /DNA_ORIENTATION=-
MPRSDYNTQYTIRRNMEEHYKRLRNIRPNVDHRNEYQYRLAKDRHKRKLRNRLVNEQMRINRENDVLCKKLIAVHTSGHTGFSYFKNSPQKIRSLQEKKRKWNQAAINRENAAIASRIRGVVAQVPGGGSKRANKYSYPEQDSYYQAASARRYDPGRSFPVGGAFSDRTHYSGMLPALDSGANGSKQIYNEAQANRSDNGPMLPPLQENQQ